MTILEPPQPSPPLGLSPIPHLDRIRLGPGHRLLLHTDGLTEAADPHGGSFPFDKHLHTALTTPDPNHALDEVVNLIHQHTRQDGTSDDLTLILAQPASAVLADQSRIPLEELIGDPARPDTWAPTSPL